MAFRAALGIRVSQRISSAVFSLKTPAGFSSANVNFLAMICAGRNEAHGFRGESWAEGRERSEGSADGRRRPTRRGVCAVGAQRWEAQSPAAQPHQEGATENWVSVEMGASKTVPPASTREETSVRHEVNPVIVRYEKDIRRTCGSVRSSLSAPARLVTVGSEAAETPFPSLWGEEASVRRLETESVNSVLGIG